MTASAIAPLIPLKKIEEYIHFESLLLIIGLSVMAYLAYRFLLRGISEDRHRILGEHFRNLSLHLSCFLILFCGFYALFRFGGDSDSVDKLRSYLGLAALLSAATIFVKIFRIFIYVYLFLSHMRVAVPVLLINLLTLLLYMVAAAWVATEIFNVRIAPLLATSAILSLVLGLALQDTLGNLFAGVALQFDKPYEIGDWIEVQSTPIKWVGKVYEITWRATILKGFADETIVVPNRVMGQAEISNFSTNNTMILRNQMFRLPYGVDIEKVKGILVGAIKPMEAVNAPLVILTEMTDSWVIFKLLYLIQDYGAQFLIGDDVISRCLTALQREKIALAQNRVLILKDNES